MKIINREQFLKLPAGILYAKYTPCIFEDIQIKYDTRNGFDEKPIDWIYQDLLEINRKDNQDYYDVLDYAQETGDSFELDLECCSRDGLYDEKQLFAVFELKDVSYLIGKLTTLLHTYPDRDDI